jgi:hypothetical protein
MLDPTPAISRAGTSGPSVKYLCGLDVCTVTACSYVSIDYFDAYTIAFDMRTTFVLPDGLVEAARAAAGLTSKTDTVVHALKELIRRKRIDELKSMFGTVDIRLDLDKVRGRGKAPVA